MEDSKGLYKITEADWILLRDMAAAIQREIQDVVGETAEVPEEEKTHVTEMLVDECWDILLARMEAGKLRETSLQDIWAENAASALDPPEIAAETAGSTRATSEDQVAKLKEGIAALSVGATGEAPPPDRRDINGLAWISEEEKRLPEFFYRVQHANSGSYQHLDGGFESSCHYQSEPVDWLRPDVLLRHVDWRNRSPTPFISLYDNEGEARMTAYEYVGQGYKGVRICKIATKDLRIQCLSALKDQWTMPVWAGEGGLRGGFFFSNTVARWRLGCFPEEDRDYCLGERSDWYAADFIDAKMVSPPFAVFGDMLAMNAASPGVRPSPPAHKPAVYTSWGLEIDI